MTLGERMRRIRTDRGLTQREVGERADMPSQTISDLECSRIENPSLNTLKNVAKALDIGVDELVGRGVSHDREELPQGLLQLLDDPEWSDEITESWIELLLQIEFEGRRLETKREFLEAYLALTRILDS